MGSDPLQSLGYFCCNMWALMIVNKDCFLSQAFSIEFEYTFQKMTCFVELALNRCMFSPVP